MTPPLLTTAEISVSLGISRQAVAKRARQGKWVPESTRVQGGGLVFDLEKISLSQEDRKRIKNSRKKAEKVNEGQRSQEAVSALKKHLTASPPPPPSPKQEPLQEEPILPYGESALIAGELGQRIFEDAQAAKELTRKAKEAAAARFEALPEERKNEARAKLELLKARDFFMTSARLKNIKKASEKFSALYALGQVPLPEWVTEYAQRSGRLSVSWSSLNRWRKDYETFGLIGLVNGYKGKAETRLPKDVQEFIRAIITAHPHIKDKRIQDACAARFPGHDLGDSSIRRFASKFRKDSEGLLLYLSNPDAWKNQQMLALGNASEKIVALNQLWEMDSTPTDLMLIDGRHSLIGCIDVWSRRPKVLVSPTSKATAISALIRRCLLDWGCPPPTRQDKNPFEGIKTDNGSDYTAMHIDMALDALQIHQPLCPPFTPKNKPHIERFFRTLSHGLVELMPGFIGHNVNERKAIEARKSFAARLMKKGEEPIKVELTSDQLQSRLDRWIEAIYMQDRHETLKMSPADKVRSWTKPVRRIENERALDLLLSPGACTRILGKQGIRHDRGVYIAAEFGYVDVGTELRILPDPTDLGTVYCYRVDGEFLCVAQDPERTGIDRAEVAARAKAIQKKIMQDGSRELRKIAKQMGTEQAYEEILQHRERQIANVAELPKRAEAFTTAALEQAGIAAEARQKQVIEPEQRRAAHAALINEMEEAGKLVPLPTEPRGRWRLYGELQRRVAAGETISDRDRDWLVTYMRSQEFRVWAEVEADLSPVSSQAK